MGVKHFQAQLDDATGAVGVAESKKLQLGE